MIYKTKDISLSPEKFHGADYRLLLAGFLKAPAANIKNVRLYKKSVDARRKNNVKYVVSFLFEADFSPYKTKADVLPNRENFFDKISKISSAEKIMVVGSGCAGLFCALCLAEAGLKPLLVERGKSVDERQKDIDNLWNDGVLNPESNVQFGLGGAGTFSDGKLTSTAHNKYVNTVFELFVKYGAPKEILTDGMPHIGTDNLKKIVVNMCRDIEAKGGKVVFNAKLTDIALSDGKIKSAVVETENGRQVIDVDRLVLATGHSARDTFAMVYRHGVRMQSKPFSVGVRIEHMREMINRSEYGDNYDMRLPAATYKLSAHLSNGRGVYTFCMCPGGEVVLSSSERETIVTNGMSYFARDEINSNSALLVSVFPEDYGDSSPLAGIEFQRKIERAAFALTGSYHAPAQNVTDFLKGKKSSEFYGVKPSVKPSAVPSDLSKCLPDFVTESLREALPLFGGRVKGFDKEGVLTGVETRSSSPIRIVRDESYASSLKNLYPCGEGSGYAGGIVTAAVDGLKCALTIIETIKNSK